jgi:hypothetical protein
MLYYTAITEEPKLYINVIQAAYNVDKDTEDFLTDLPLSCLRILLNTNIMMILLCTETSIMAVNILS